MAISPKGKREKNVTEDAPAALAYPLAQEPQKDPALAQIIALWPSLSEPIRRAVLALVEAAQSAR